MNNEYILKIFCKGSNERKNEQTRTITRNFGVDINVDVVHLSEVIEKLLDAFPIIKQASFPHLKLDNIKYHIEQQIQKTKEELKIKASSL